LSIARSLVADEVEEPVANDRTTPGAAVLVVSPFSLLCAGGREVVLSPQLFVRVVLERRAMEIVGAALDLNIDRGSAGEPLLAVETVGHDVDGLERFERRHVGRNMRQPDVGGAHAVDPNVIGA